jgi:uncharacterized membrane protein YvlD (DUF360 family)
VSDHALRAPASEVGWQEERLRIRPVQIVRTWLFSALALLVAAWILPGADVNGFWGAAVAALVVALLNAILPPIVAAVRLPLTLVFGFLLVLVLDAWMLMAAGRPSSSRSSPAP